MISTNECILKILSTLIKSKNNYVSGRPLTYNIDHYIEIILKVLCSGCQWNSLNEKLHYTVYHKHFMKWTKLGIFSELFKIISIIVI